MLPLADVLLQVSMRARWTWSAQPAPAQSHPTNIQTITTRAASRGVQAGGISGFCGSAHPPCRRHCPSVRAALDAGPPHVSVHSLPIARALSPLAVFVRLRACVRAYQACIEAQCGWGIWEEDSLNVCACFMCVRARIRLVLRGNAIGGYGARALAEALCSCALLSHLDLQRYAKRDLRLKDLFTIYYCKLLKESC